MLNFAKKIATGSITAFKHGAVITRNKNGGVLGTGYNTRKTHPKWGSPKPHNKTGKPMWGLHAEAAAIRDALRKGANLKGAIMYVARINGSKKSRPCPNCRRLIRKHKIKKVVYTDGEGKVATEWPPPLAPCLSTIDEQTASRICATKPSVYSKV